LAVLFEWKMTKHQRWL